jgi:hypothetical protein
MHMANPGIFDLPRYSLPARKRIISAKKNASFMEVA